MRKFLIGLAGLALAAPAPAQDWATPEVCAVDVPRIHADVFEPPGLAALQDQATTIPNGTGRFWQITAPGGAVSHLWGTFHSSDPHILRLVEQVRPQIEASRIVAVEIDYTHPTRSAFRDAQYLPGRYNEASDPFAFDQTRDATIAGLPSEISGWILDRAIELGWTEDADLILSPAGMAEMLLSDPCEDFTSGIVPIQDDYIHLIGRLAGAEIRGLEAPDAFFDDLSEQEETANALTAVYGAYLRPTRDNRARSTSFALYQRGQIGVMATWDTAFLAEVLGDRSDEALQLTNDYLLDFRNARFVDAIGPELTEGGVFIAVGAGHLPGPGGMVARLRAEGYDVTRVPLPGEFP